VHDGSISPCEGANPEGKKEGAGKQTKQNHQHFKNLIHDEFCE
jgi:hypothetical protein